MLVERINERFEQVSLKDKRVTQLPCATLSKTTHEIIIFVIF